MTRTILSVAPGALSAPTFSRGSTADYIDANGVLQSAAVDVVRDGHYENGTRTILLEGATTNLLANPSAPATQAVSLAAGTYTLSVAGAGSCTVSGGPTGTATASAPLTFTLAATTSVTFTVSGSLTRFQCEAGAFATSFIDGSRSADLIGWTIPDAPHAMEWIVEFFERGIIKAMNDAGIASLGNDAQTGATAYFRTSVSELYAFVHANGTTALASTIPDGNTPAIGDRVRLRGVLYADGSVQIFQSLNGGAEVAGDRTAAIPFAASWGGQTFRLNSRGTGSQGNAAYLSAALTDLSIHHPSISFTDAQGPVTITALGPTLNNWQPDVADYPPAVTALGTGVSHQLPVRTDYLASFELPNIAPAQFGDLLRLKRWLVNGGGTGTGGTITVNTADNQLRSYTCTLAPGTSPSWTFDDRQMLEYTLHVTVRNTAAVPMLCDYSPT